MKRFRFSIFCMALLFCLMFGSSVYAEEEPAPGEAFGESAPEETVDTTGKMTDTPADEPASEDPAVEEPSAEEPVTIQTGWVKKKGKWYYLDEKGHEVSGWMQDGDAWYWFDQKHQMVTGWKMIGDKWYLFRMDGVMKIGWVNIDGSWYYLNASGNPQKGWVIWRGEWYNFGSNGVMKTGWVSYGNDWFYLDSSGILQRDQLRKIGGVYYYLYHDGHALQLEDQMAAELASTMNGDLMTAFMYAVDNVSYYGRSLFDRTWTTKELSQYGLTHKEGNCYVKAAVFCELARAMGYEAYMITGYVMVEGGWARHGWVEIVIKGETYVFDPYVRYRFGLQGSYMFHYGLKGTYIYNKPEKMD